MGVDVRGSGSGNIGATNVARTAGARAGLITLFVDMAKGALPVLAGVAAGASPTALSCAALAAVLGHVFSVFSFFRGGKGVATAAGAFAVLAPAAVAIAVTVFVVLAVTTGWVSLASMGAVVLLPFALMAFGSRGPELAAAVATAALIVFTHRANIRRLLTGREPRFEVGKRE